MVYPLIKNKTNEGITITNDPKKLKQTDLYIIAVSDNAVKKVSNILPKNSFVVHTSGCISINKIKQSRRGVFILFKLSVKEEILIFHLFP